MSETRKKILIAIPARRPQLITANFPLRRQRRVLKGAWGAAHGKMTSGVVHGMPLAVLGAGSRAPGKVAGLRSARRVDASKAPMPATATAVEGV